MKSILLSLLLILMVSILIPVAIACTSSSSSTSSTTTSASTTTTSTSTTQSTTPATTSTSTPSSTLTSTTQTVATSVTFQSLAATGQSVYSSNCSTCHGNNGQGANAPALWGSGASLSKFKTATGLLGFISNTMPMNSPGSLSHQQYLDVLAYILTQDNQASPDTVFNESQLSGIALK
jgi:mono/diheme cytochrome c family protein